jgi:arylsulfatase A-like enzyme
VGTAVWVTVLDIVYLVAQRRAQLWLGDIFWVASATFSLAVALAALFAVAIARLLQPDHSPRTTRWDLLAGTSKRRVATTVGLLGLSAWLHHLDETMWVRLYQDVHFITSLAVIAVAVVGWMLVWRHPQDRHAAEHPLPRTQPRHGTMLWALSVWAGLFMWSVDRVLAVPLRRVVAVEHMTLLSRAVKMVPRDGWQRRWSSSDSGQGGGLALAPLSSEGRSGTSGSHPNVVLVTVDSMRWDGVPRGNAMEQLASQGVTFERTYAPSCWTIHSMSAVLTSRLPSQLRFTPVSVDVADRMTPYRHNDPRLANPANFRKVTPVPWDDDTQTLPGILSLSGWQTATAIAYVFYKPQAGITRGFEVVDETPYREHNRDNRGTTSPALTNAGIGFLRHRDPSRPFFLWLHYMDPHAPYAPQDAAASGADARARYNSELRLVDRELARLFDDLRTLGLWDTTWIVLHADHGEEFREHGGQFHATTVYEEQVRVPLVVKPPATFGVAVGVRRTPVSLLDVMPTLLDALGLAPGLLTAGRSLVAALRRGEPRQRPLVVECQRFDRDLVAVVDGTVKLIRNRSAQAVELYDLAADPNEQHNQNRNDDSLPPELLRMAGGLPTSPPPTFGCGGGK